MLWFLIAILGAFATYAMHSERNRDDGTAAGNALGVLLMAGVVAFFFNILFSAVAVPNYTAFDADVDGTIQTKIVNSEAVFTFKAKGQEFSIPTDDVVIKVGDKPHYKVTKSDSTSKWITLFNTKDQSEYTVQTLTVPTS
jgi:hypothetical protein